MLVEKTNWQSPQYLNTEIWECCFVHTELNSNEHPSPRHDGCQYSKEQHVGQGPYIYRDY